MKPKIILSSPQTDPSRSTRFPSLPGRLLPLRTTLRLDREASVWLRQQRNKCCFPGPWVQFGCFLLEFMLKAAFFVSLSRLGVFFFFIRRSVSSALIATCKIVPDFGFFKVSLTSYQKVCRRSSADRCVFNISLGKWDELGPGQAGLVMRQQHFH